MKKLFLISSVVASLFSSSAFAKTEGSYLGIDAIRGSLRFEEVFSNNNYPAGKVHNNGIQNNGFGMGVSYKYAFNFKNIYLAPGVFAEQYDLSANRIDVPIDYPRRLQVNNRYGTKLDLGYDVTKYFAPYVTGGYSLIHYKSTNYNDTAGVIKTKNVIGDSGSWFFGAGLKFDVSKNISISTEYNTQKFRAKTAIPNNNVNYSGYFKSRVDVMKVGVAYKF